MVVRVGVLSTAKIARDKVIPAMLAAGSCSVAAIASRDVGRARAVAEQHGIPQAFGSYEELLESDEVDAVYIPLPNHLHARWTTAAAEAGKHVLCEKPLAPNAAEAEAMVEACAAQGVTLMEAYMYRFHPQWLRVRDLVSSGELGELQIIHSGFCFYNRDPQNIRNVADFGGGALLDVGCYTVDSARWLFGTEPGVAGAEVRTDPDFGTDVLATAVLGFGEGRHAAVTCGTQTARSQWVRAAGSRGGVYLDTPFDITGARTASITHFSASGGDTDVETTRIVNHYEEMVEAFAQSILRSEPVPLSPREGVATLRVLEQLRSTGAPG